MLLRFQVSNFASIYREQELSLVALDQHPDLAVSYVPGEDLYALPAVGIFGANASGKSNIIKAIEFARDAVRCSHHRWRPDDQIPHWPFYLADEGRYRPSRFVFDLVAAGVRYTYGFALDDTAIHQEWLYAYPNGRRQVYFERDRDTFRFGHCLIGSGERIAETVRANSLLLSAAGTCPGLDSVYGWFGPDNAVPANDEADDRTLALIRFAGLEPVGAWLTSVGPHGCVHPGQLTKREPASVQIWRNLLGRVLPTLDTGGLLTIDALGAGLHPLLVAQVIRWFHDPAINRHGAQLLFTTHHTGPLGRHLGAQLARDQVWLTEKDQYGATRLIPLTELRVHYPDDPDDVEGCYLEGRYGAAPFLDENLLAVLTGLD